MTFQVGDKVWYRGPYDRDDRRTTVTRVGRKNAYVKIGWKETAFDKGTGWEIQYANSVGSGGRIMTDATIQEEELRKALAKRLADHGVTSTGYGGFKLSTALLERLVAVLDEEVGS